MRRNKERDADLNIPLPLPFSFISTAMKRKCILKNMKERRRTGGNITREKEKAIGKEGGRGKRAKKTGKLN